MANIESGRKPSILDRIALTEDGKRSWPEPKPLTIDQQRGRLGPHKTAQEMGFPISTSTEPPTRIGSHLIAPQIAKSSIVELEEVILN